MVSVGVCCVFVNSLFHNSFYFYGVSCILKEKYQFTFKKFIMKFFTKTLIGSWILLNLILWYSFTFWESQNDSNILTTKEVWIYEEAEKIANRYIEINRNDDFWSNNNPRLWEITLLYMEKNTPSYIEYSVICENNLACWFIIVNVDWDDVQVPKASSSDFPASNILTEKSWIEKENLQFYYFGPFDIYSKEILTGRVNALNPQIDWIVDDEEIGGMQDVEKKEIKEIKILQEQQLQKILQEKIDFYTQYRNSEEYQKDKKEFQTQYNPQSPGSVQNGDRKYVKWNYTSQCNSRVPCYEQFRYWYSWKWCATWCSPVAVAMIYGYHDRMNNYPELLPDDIAAAVNGKNSPENIKDMIEDLREYMGTFCDWFAGSTYDSQIEEGKQFAWARWYTMTHAWLTSQYIEAWIKQQIDSWRPIVINIWGISWNTTGHSIVWFGYFKPQNPPPNITPLPLVKINAGWWNNNDSNATIDLWSSFSLNSKLRTVDNVVYYIVQ